MISHARLNYPLLICFVASSLLGITPLQAEELPVAKITFDEHVQPILRQKCGGCHNPDKRSGDLDMTTYSNLMQGGGSGAVIEPGGSTASYLYRLVTHEEEPTMPPESPRIADAMIDVLRDWIDGGALENASSKATVPRRKSKTLAPAQAGERPEQVAMPGRLSLEPVHHASRNGAVSEICTSPWAPLAAVAGYKQVVLYQTDTVRILGVLPFPEGVPHDLKFSGDGSLLLAGGGQGAALGRVVVWDVRTGERIWEIGDELDEVLAADIRGDFGEVSLGSPQRVVRTYSTETGELIREYRKHTDWITALAYSPDGVLLATADRSGGLVVWEAHTGREYLTLGGHGGAINSLSWRTDSNAHATCSEDGLVRIWEMENGRQITQISAHGGGTSDVEFARDGRLVSAGRDRVVKLWQPDGTHAADYQGLSELALAVSICDETNRVIGADWNGQIRVWNVADGSEIGQLQANPPTLAMRARQADALAAQQAQVHVAAMAKHSQATGRLQTVTAAAQEIEANAAALTKQLAATQVTISQLRQEIDAATVAKATADSTIATLSAVLPELEKSVTAARAAVGAAPDDADLAKVAGELEDIVKDRQGRLAAAQSVQGIKPGTLQSLMDVEVEMQQNTANLATAQARHNELMAEVATSTQEVEQTATEVVASQQALEPLQAAVARWRGEIEFVNRLVEVRQRRQSVEESVYEQELRLSELRNEVQQAEQEAKTRKTALEAVEQELSELQGIE